MQSIATAAQLKTLTTIGMSLSGATNATAQDFKSGAGRVDGM
jgi:hypothetical protein